MNLNSRTHRRRRPSRSARFLGRLTARPRILVAVLTIVIVGAVVPSRVLGGGDDAAGTRSMPAEFADEGGVVKGKQEPEWDGRTKVLGDGSTSYTGPQSDQLKPTPLRPGRKPPQFVVFSWDGGLQGGDQLFSHYRELAKAYNAHMTFFLTGIYLLPKAKASLYRPPMHKPGVAAISYPTDEHIRATLGQLSKAWEDENEIGSHFTGHFCGVKGGGDWTVEERTSEIRQFYSFMENWKTNTGYTDIPALPFDPRRDITGGRAPCLEGQKNLLPAAKSFGWRYDASSTGDFQIWPTKKNGIWDFPLQMLPYEGGKYQGLSMDFNFLYNQANGETDGDPAKYGEWERGTVKSYMAGFNRLYYGSRAPMIIGNHFENWNGGIYMKAVDEVVKNVCVRKDVRCVSFRELADWMDVQKPETLERLRSLDPAQSPDWTTVVK